MIRNFKTSSTLLLECISTFNSPEIISFNDLVYYTVLTSLISLPRSSIKEKLVHSPEVLSTIREVPYLKQFLDSFYKCDYKQFFLAFGIYIIFIVSLNELKSFSNQYIPHFISKMNI